jgi:Zn-dependent alcohol dehydrogenase
MRTRAAILAEHNKPLVVDEVELADPSPDQVLVKLYASGICHSQLHQTHSAQQALPGLLGHEATGTVTAAGRNVTHVREGDKVFVTWVPRTPRDARPGAATGVWKGKTAVSQNVWTWAEDVLCDEAYVVKMPDGTAMDVTAPIGCAVITGCGAVTTTANVQPGETVAVFGCGGVGLCAIQAAANVGAGMVIAVDLDQKKLDFARQFGATHVVNGAETNAVEAVRALTNGGADYAFDAIGVAQTMAQIVEAARGNRWGVTTGGTAVLVGVPTTPATIDAMQLLLGEKIFRGSLGGSGTPERDFLQYVSWFKEGRLPLEKLVTQRYTLDQVNEGVQALERGEIFGRSIMVYG